MFFVLLSLVVAFSNLADANVLPAAWEKSPWELAFQAVDDIIDKSLEEYPVIDVVVRILLSLFWPGETEESPRQQLWDEMVQEMRVIANATAVEIISGIVQAEIKTARDLLLRFQNFELNNTAQRSITISEAAATCLGAFNQVFDSDWKAQFLPLIAPLATTHLTIQRIIYFQQKRLFNLEQDDPANFQAMNDTYWMYMDFINANWDDWYSWRVAQIIQEGPFENGVRFSVQDKVTGYVVQVTDNFCNAQTCNLNLAPDTAQQLRAEATMLNWRAVAPFSFLNRLVVQLEHLPYIVPDFLKVNNGLASLGTYTSYNNIIIADVVGNGQPTLQWDQPGNIVGISGQGFQFLQDLQFRYSTHNGFVIGPPALPVFDWNYPELAQKSRYVTAMEMMWGGTVPGIITNIRLTLNGSDTIPWPNLNRGEWGGPSTNITAGPGLRIVALGQVGRGAPDQLPAIGAIAFQFAHNGLFEAGYYDQYFGAQALSAISAGRFQDCNITRDPACLDLTQRCTRHAQSPVCAGDSATTRYMCVYSSTNSTLEN